MSLADICEDVILIICDNLQCMHTQGDTSIKNFSLVNQRLRSLLVPLLFKTIHINRPISQLSRTPPTKPHARNFKIDMFGSMWWWCSGSYTTGSDVLDLFHSIQSLDNLKTLEVRMMGRSIDIFVAAFREKRVEDTSIFVLEKVEDLIVTSSAAFLLSHCPNLKRLEIQDGSDCLLETYTDLTRKLTPLCSQVLSNKISGPQLIHFDAAAAWSTDELGVLVTSFPNLRHLRMRTDTYCYRASTATIIDILGSSLSSLRALHLVKIALLDVGYQSVWRRNIQKYSNADYRRMLWLENEQLRVRMENNVTRCAFKTISNLQECWLGDKRVARKCPEGMRAYNSLDDTIYWMWERRMEDVDEYALGSHVLSFKIEKESVVLREEKGW